MGRGSLLLADVDVLGVDHLVARLARAAAGRPARSRSTRSTRGTRRWPALLRLRLVHDLGQLVRGLGQVLARALHGVGVLALQGLPSLGHGLFELPLLRRPELLLVLVVGLLGVVDQAVEL